MYLKIQKVSILLAFGFNIKVFILIITFANTGFFPEPFLTFAFFLAISAQYITKADLNNII